MAISVIDAVFAPDGLAKPVIAQHHLGRPGSLRESASRCRCPCRCLTHQGQRCVGMDLSTTRHPIASRRGEMP